MGHGFLLLSYGLITFIILVLVVIFHWCFRALGTLNDSIGGAVPLFTMIARDDLF